MSKRKKLIPFPTMDKYRREDGSIVIHIDTHDIPDNVDGPMLTIYLNDDTDDPLWRNPRNAGLDENGDLIRRKLR